VPRNPETPPDRYCGVTRYVSSFGWLLGTISQQALEITPGEYVKQAASPREYYESSQQTFGPLVAIRARLADWPERLPALDRDFLESSSIRTVGQPPVASR
jgi:hypothetical protein